MAGDEALVAKLDEAYRAQREGLARLEADVLRSNEYENAASLYLRYYALAGVTLGTYPEEPTIWADCSDRAIRLLRATW